MRTTFVRVLCDLASKDERIWLLTGDLGYSVLEPFAKQFPERFLNMGVAEQNMMGVATGLALTGNVVFVYSIVNFATMRCLEQIRNDICYHEANVKIASVGAGLTYGAQGYTHHGLEDLAVMRALPNLTVVAPGDALEVEAMLPVAAAQPGPWYIRLGRAPQSPVHLSRPEFAPGRPIVLTHGNRVAVAASGSGLSLAAQMVDHLSKRGVVATLLSVPCLKPVEREVILGALGSAQVVVSVEDHSLCGGLRSVLAEMLVCDHKWRRLVSVGLMGDRWVIDSGDGLRSLAAKSPDPEELAGLLLDSLRSFGPEVAFA